MGNLFQFLKSDSFLFSFFQTILHMHPRANTHQCKYVHNAYLIYAHLPFGNFMLYFKRPHCWYCSWLFSLLFTHQMWSVHSFNTPSKAVRLYIGKYLSLEHCTISRHSFEEKNHHGQQPSTLLLRKETECDNTVYWIENKKGEFSQQWIVAAVVGQVYWNRVNTKICKLEHASIFVFVQ